MKQLQPNALNGSIKEMGATYGGLVLNCGCTEKELGCSSWR